MTPTNDHALVRGFPVEFAARGARRGDHMTRRHVQMLHEKAADHIEFVAQGRRPIGT
jgi:hypothetical protein